MTIEVAGPPGALMTTEELARLMKVDPSTVRRWRTSTPVQGPPFIRLSARVVKYDPDDVRTWLERHRTDPTEVAR
jgi:phage terminase Nu1 subunit (DNA packaging protein)